VATRRAFADETETALEQRWDVLYDVSHSLAKIESHVIDGPLGCAKR